MVSACYNKKIYCFVFKFYVLFWLDESRPSSWQIDESNNEIAQDSIYCRHCGQSFPASRIDLHEVCLSFGIQNA